MGTTSAGRGNAVPTVRVKVRRHKLGESRNEIGGRATLAVEEPLEMRIDGHVIATTMRTPGNDFDLALGYAITDAGVDPTAVEGMQYCGPEAGEVVASRAAADLTGPFSGGFNTINLSTRGGTGPPVARRRQTPVSTACGICGAEAIEDLLDRTSPVHDNKFTICADVVAGIGQTVLTAQPGFEATGALHAAAALDAHGNLHSVREDVGRHNAVDKVIGDLATTRRLPADDLVLFTSGRVAFEIVAKALIAGVSTIVAVSAPTSLAVEIAQTAGLTLIGFARGNEFTVYSQPERVC